MQNYEDFGKQQRKVGENLHNMEKKLVLLSFGKDPAFAGRRTNLCGMEVQPLRDGNTTSAVGKYNLDDLAPPVAVISTVSRN